jgi:predicted DNA-binding ribbon-helix-helix protein
MNEDRETVQVWLTDAEFLALAKIAHEKNITFNQLATEILEDHLRQQEAKKDAAD